jgi:hypothetical protein
MALTITDQVIRASGTRHTATASDSTGWTVTWLPGQILTRSQAITAMLIAQAAAKGGRLAIRGHTSMRGPANWG